MFTVKITAKTPIPKYGCIMEITIDMSRPFRLVHFNRGYVNGAGKGER